MISLKQLKDIDYMEIGNTIQISGAVFSDGKTSFILNLPDERITSDIWDVEMTREDWKTFLRQADLKETQVLMEDKGKVKRAILRKSTRQIDSAVSWNVYRRDNYTCRYCGRNDVPLTVDHLVLWEDGGPSIEENLLSACRRCNKLRGNIKYKDWIFSTDYEKLSVKLPREVYKANEEIRHTLADIPIRLHIPDRNKSKKKKKRR